MIKQFFATFGDLGQVLWLGSISMTLHFVLQGVPFRKEINFHPEDHLRKYHIVIWTLSVILGLGQAIPEYALFGKYNDIDQCTLDPGFIQEQSYTRLAGLYSFWILISAYLIRNSIMIRKQISAMETISLDENADVDINRQKNETLQNLKRLFTYPILLTIDMLLAILYRTLLLFSYNSELFFYLYETGKFILSGGVVVVFLSAPCVRSEIKNAFSGIRKAKSDQQLHANLLTL
jgi:hypothetical protein